MFITETVHPQHLKPHLWTMPSFHPQASWSKHQGDAPSSINSRMIWWWNPNIISNEIQHTIVQKQRWNHVTYFLLMLFVVMVCLKRTSIFLRSNNQKYILRNDLTFGSCFASQRTRRRYSSAVAGGPDSQSGAPSTGNARACNSSSLLFSYAGKGFSKVNPISFRGIRWDTTLRIWNVSYWTMAKIWRIVVTHGMVG